MKNNITLAIAILGAVTGMISFSMNVFDYIKYRPRLGIECRIFDFSNKGESPDFVFALKYINLGKNRISLLKAPKLYITNAKGKKFGPYTLFPTDKKIATLSTALEPFAMDVVTYKSPDLIEDIQKRKSCDFRKEKDKITFYIEIDNTTGKSEVSLKGYESMPRSLIKKSS